MTKAEPAVEDVVSRGSRRTVGGLGDDLGLDAPGVLGRDDVLQGGGAEDGDVEFEDVGVGDGLRAGEADDGAGVLFVLEGGLPVDAVVGVGAALGVADRHDPEAEEIAGKLGHELTGVAVALDGDGLAGEIEAEVPGRLADAVAGTPGGGVVAALRAAEDERLARDEAGHVVADHLRVLVHHPRHDLGSGVDVGGRNVAVRADEAAEGADPAAGEPLKLAGAEVLGVADAATLAAAIGQAHDGDLPGHPRGEGADGVYGLLGVEADAALAGAAGIVVLDAEALEDLSGAVVHPDGDGDAKLAHGHAQELMGRLVEAEDGGGVVELSLGNLKRVEVLLYRRH